MRAADRDLVRLALAAAADMDARAAPATAGLLRRLAGRIVELAAVVPSAPDPGTCRGCGTRLVARAGPGRPRAWCSERCRSRARKSGRDQMMS